MCFWGLLVKKCRILAKTGHFSCYCYFMAKSTQKDMFLPIFCIFDQQTSETHKISSLEDGMRRFLRPKFWSHGTHLGSLGPLSWKEGPLGFPQTQFRVTLDPYDLPVLVAWLGDPENPKLFRAWCVMCHHPINLGGSMFLMIFRICVDSSVSSCACV